MHKVDFAQLLPLVKANRQDAQMTLIRAFLPLIRSFLSWEHNPCNREDLQSILILRLLEVAKNYDCKNVKAFPGYVRTSLANMAGNYNDREEHIRETKEKISQEPTEDAYTMETAFDKEDHKALHKALKRLYTHERKLLIDYYKKNKSMDEIAHENHTSKSKVHYQIKRLLRDLTAVLKDEF